MNSAEEVALLEEHDAKFGLGPTGVARLEAARRARESEKRQDRRVKADARQLQAEKLTAHKVALDAGFTALEALVQARKELDTARAECAAAERAARAAGVLEHRQTHGAAEIAFFDSRRWRSLHDEARVTVTGSLL